MIVARGLGRGFGSVLVTAGLGLIGQVTQPPAPQPPPTGAGGGSFYSDRVSIRPAKPIDADRQLIEHNNQMIIAAMLRILSEEP